MGGLQSGFLLGSLFVCASCAAPAGLDLRKNDKLYRSTGYRVALPADLPVCVLPVVDRRTAPVAEASSPYPTTFVADGRWERPVQKMIDEIVRDEVRDSGVFKEVVDTPTPATALLRVEIANFEGGIQEVINGRRTFATTRFTVRVEGPEVDGQRPLLFADEMGQHTESDTVMTPPSPLLLLGRCLRMDVQSLLGKLDQENVGRSAVASPGR